jgi:cyclopropane fatty-acyl-phospholipid synthase-like methyltransferase
MIAALAARGLSATGLDLSPKMLAAAEHRAAAAAAQVHCVEADMRDFNVEKRFSLYRAKFSASPERYR